MRLPNAPNTGMAPTSAARRCTNNSLRAISAAETPSGLRSLDAIHLAAAQRAGTALRAVVTYDLRMLSAAADLGMATASPD